MVFGEFLPLSSLPVLPAWSRCVASPGTLTTKVMVFGEVLSFMLPFFSSTWRRKVTVFGELKA